MEAFFVAALQTRKKKKKKTFFFGPHFYLRLETLFLFLYHNIHRVPGMRMQMQMQMHA